MSSRPVPRRAEINRFRSGELVERGNRLRSQPLPRGGKAMTSNMLESKSRQWKRVAVEARVGNPPGGLSRATGPPRRRVVKKGHTGVEYKKRWMNECRKSAQASAHEGAASRGTRGAKRGAKTAGRSEAAPLPKGAMDKVAQAAKRGSQMDEVELTAEGRPQVKTAAAPKQKGERRRGVSPLRRRRPPVDVSGLDLSASASLELCLSASWDHECRSTLAARSKMQRS